MCCHPASTDSPVLSECCVTGVIDSSVCRKHRTSTSGVVVTLHCVCGGGCGSLPAQEVTCVCGVHLSQICCIEQLMLFFISWRKKIHEIDSLQFT